MKLDKTLGKRNPLKETDLKDFEKKYKEKKISLNSWLVKYEDLNKKNYQLIFDNPKEPKEYVLRDQDKIVKLVKDNNDKIKKLFNSI